MIKIFQFAGEAFERKESVLDFAGSDEDAFPISKNKV